MACRNVADRRALKGSRIWAGFYKMNQQWKTREIRPILGFAAGLVVCGVISGTVFFGWKEAGMVLAPVPFAVLCGVVCVRPWQRMLPAILMLCLAWLPALSIAVRMDQDGRGSKGMYLAGLAGGLGVGLSMAVGWGKGRWVRISALTGVVGMISAWPFTLRWPEFGWNFSFVAWQVSVGMCVYAMARLARWSGKDLQETDLRLNLNG